MLAGNPNTRNASKRVARYTEVQPEIARLFKQRRFREALELLLRRGLA